MLVITSLVCGVVNMQNRHAIAYYLCKLNSRQKSYTSYVTIENELLSVVVTLKEFHTMLYSTKITVYTHHKNLTFCNLTSQHVMICWHNFLKEYLPTFKYTP